MEGKTPSEVGPEALKHGPDILGCLSQEAGFPMVGEGDASSRDKEQNLHHSRNKHQGLLG